MSRSLKIDDLIFRDRKILKIHGLPEKYLESIEKGCLFSGSLFVQLNSIITDPTGKHANCRIAFAVWNQMVGRKMLAWGLDRLLLRNLLSLYGRSFAI